MIKDFYDGMTLDEIYTKRIKYNSPVLERLSTLESILKNIKVQFTGNYNDLTNKPDLTIYAVNSEIQGQLDSIGVSISDIEDEISDVINVELARLETDKVDYTDGNIDLAVGKTYKINTTSIFDIIYPIGSIIMTQNADFDPADNFGGTWEQVTSDAYLKIVSSGAGTLGGVSDHKISSAKMPNHTHGLRFALTAASASGVEYTIVDWADPSTTNSFIGSTGGGEAYYPYYLGIYCWRRIADEV